MTVKVRGECLGDEEAVDAVNCRAFAKADEAQIVSDMRVLSPTYDRRVPKSSIYFDLRLGALE